MYIALDTNVEKHFEFNQQHVKVQGTEPSDLSWSTPTLIYTDKYVHVFLNCFE